MSARAAAHASWAATLDRSARTAAARRAWQETHFEDVVDPDRKLDPKTRAQMATSARKAYFAALALKSAQARRRQRAASQNQPVSSARGNPARVKSRKRTA